MLDGWRDVGLFSGSLEFNAVADLHEAIQVLRHYPQLEGDSNQSTILVV